ncbi:hypothetical protein VMCG_04711 [Cytospora schulzeri]|uniref:Uncharacterized protein n=1 Tax=Cytospora schulzeri TaxID=448051 RepID=A0A423WRB5_9PEZI|nr:hypothetical protein VMCG_04711 [Valsa malicola]
MPMQMVPSQPRQQAYVTLTPYIRRLVATGFDVPSILHGFFGDDWAAGIGPLHEAERRNYLFAAKSDNWLKVKASYDMDAEQIIPFLKPLQNGHEHLSTLREELRDMNQGLGQGGNIITIKIPRDDAGLDGARTQEDRKS